MNIAIIPAKGTSRRIPGKNRRHFWGRPIIGYSIRAALESHLFGRVYVSTEDPMIAAIASEEGADVIERPPELAEIGTADVGTQAVTRHAILHLIETGKDIDDVCCIYPCAPMLSAKDLIVAFNLLCGPGTPDYVFSVIAEPLSDAGMFYFGQRDAFVYRRPVISPYSVMLPIPPERAIDINTERDWIQAQEMYSRLITIHQPHK